MSLLTCRKDKPTAKVKVKDAASTRTPASVSVVEDDERQSKCGRHECSGSSGVLGTGGSGVLENRLVALQLHSG
jgi:hypothetical protein